MPGKPAPTPDPKLSTRLVTGIKNGDRRAIAKALTLVESSLAADQENSEVLLTALLPLTGRALKVGVSGIPGVGKSSLVDVLGLDILQQEPKARIAILAIDPSSPLSGGSILGDKTRMEDLAAHPQVFIRPSPAGGCGGGIARHSRESLLVLDAAGFDYLLVESVGVGQAELQIAQLVDVLVLLQMPSTGDELQGMKKGLLELADIVAINKADGPLLPAAKLAQAELKLALHSLSAKQGWQVPVLLVSAAERRGMSQLWAKVREFCSQQKTTGAFSRRRLAQQKAWLAWELDQQWQLLVKRYADPAFVQELETAMTKNLLLPPLAAQQLIKQVLSKV